MRRFLALVFVATTLVLASCSRPAQKTMTVTLAPEPGPGRTLDALETWGPASEPIGGQLDLSNETVRGVPDSLSDLDVRFLDFQWQLLLSDAFADGRIDSAEYYR